MSGKVREVSGTEPSPRKPLQGKAFQEWRPAQEKNDVTSLLGKRESLSRRLRGWLGAGGRLASRGEMVLEPRTSRLEGRGAAALVLSGVHALELRNDGDAISEPSSDSTVAGWTGLEPAASAVTGRRYNQLNYHPRLSPAETSTGHGRGRQSRPIHARAIYPGGTGVSIIESRPLFGGPAAPTRGNACHACTDACRSVPLRPAALDRDTVRSDRNRKP